MFNGTWEAERPANNNHENTQFYREILLYLAQVDKGRLKPELSQFCKVFSHLHLICLYHDREVDSERSTKSPYQFLLLILVDVYGKQGQ